MAEMKFKPVAHNQGAFLKKASKRRGFREAYEGLAESTRSHAKCYRREAALV